MSEPSPRLLGRYALHDALASGGMATVHLARLLGSEGFARTVAIKRLHANFARDPDFAAMFLDEARLAARIRHPNVVQTLDVVSTDGELFVVLDYVQGESLSRLVRQAGGSIDPGVCAAVVAGVLHGLHAAHEARNEKGEPLGLVHRDVSPQNVMVGADGIARVLDFGVAKAIGRSRTTRDGQVKGKLAYMAPEQLSGAATRQSDIFASSIVLWEMLTRDPLFAGEDQGAVMSRVLSAPIPSPSERRSGLPETLVAVVMRGLERDPAKRFATAREMAIALEKSVTLATTSEVGAWVEATAHETLSERAKLVTLVEMGEPALATSKSAVEEPSSVSVATPNRPHEKSGGRKLAIGAVLLVACAGATALYVARSRSRTSDTRAAAAASASTVPEANASAPPAAEPSESAAAAVPNAPWPAVRGSSTRPKTTRPPTTPSSKRKPNCDPPYTLGPNGEKIWTRECM